jgi:hypothetical protein
MPMESIQKALDEWQATLCKELDVSALYARSPVAHKWKATYRSMCLRETVSWRFVDLVNQSLLLHKNGKALVALGRTKGSDCIQEERVLRWGNFRP